MSDYVMPSLPNPHDKYFTKVTPIDNGPRRMNHIQVEVYKSALPEPELIYTYVREYGGLAGTFEPFRQLRDGVWHDYALIAPEIYRFCVLDLEKREIIARESYPKLTARRAELYNNGSKEGDDDIAAGFCPTVFYVPDALELYKHLFLDEETSELMEFEHLSHYRKLIATSLTGEFALYGGCHWGDDGSDKLRYIDLSKIDEGIVTSDERFGYVEILNDFKKSLSLEFENEGIHVSVTTQLRADLKTGKFDSEPRDGINWNEEEE